MNTSITDQLLSTTRSVRRRLDLDRAVDDEVILECIRLAVQSPTASNTQRWRWVVVTDPDLRAQLQRLYAGDARPRLEARANDETADPQRRRVYASALYLLDILDRVPVHVIPCIEGRIQSSDNFAAATLYGSILPAVWSFMLALRARGLGSAWTTLHLANEGAVAELLGIPEEVSQVALLPVAYTLGTTFSPATRPPVELITYWNGWDVTRPGSNG